MNKIRVRKVKYLMSTHSLRIRIAVNLGTKANVSILAILIKKKNPAFIEQLSIIFISLFIQSPQ